MEKIENKGTLRGKVAIITGASSGIGKSIALELAKQGAIAVTTARNEDKLQALEKQMTDLGYSSSYFVTDIQKEENCKSIINYCVDKYGRIDILINNAGISMRANFKDLQLDVLHQVMNTNFWGSVYCTKYALPYILEKQGSIVGISSVSGITPLPARTGYVASKHALDGFFQTIRLENKDENLHVMLVHPGFTSSNIRNVALNHQGKPQGETPRNEERMMSSEEVAVKIYRGIIHKKEDLVLTWQGKLIKCIFNNLPKLANRLIYNEMKKEVGAPF